MTDTRLTVAELRAGELLVALQSAVRGDAHWRYRASQLLRQINDLELPELSIEALREADARKRAVECMNDLVHDNAIW